MNSNLTLIIVGIIIGCFIGYLIAKVYFMIKLRNQRKNAVDRSRAVVMGQVNEKIAPLLPNFPYHYKDLSFLGKGVDYVVFDGLHSGQVREIVFLEIKSGVSALNRNEQAIRECINDKRVRYEIYKI